MTYREAIDRYIKNEECKEFVIHHLISFLDEKVDDESSHNMLYQIFNTIQLIYRYTLFPSEQRKMFGQQMFYISSDIKERNITTVYEWKSIPEWLGGLSDDVFKEHFLFLYKEVVSVLQGEERETYENFKSHNLVTAVGDLYNMACRKLERTVVYMGGEISKKLKYTDAMMYFNDNIAGKLQFILEYGREPNDFDDFGEHRQ